MNQTRTAYLDSYRALRPLAASPEMSERWDTESALKALSVRGLAGHLVVRTGRAVLDYLAEQVPPGASPIEAADYYATVLARMDDAEHEQVRVRGEAAAPDGSSGLIARFDGAVEMLEPVLAREPEDRTLMVYGGLVMRLDDYLVTRMCEILVHADDLAVSLDLDVPDFPAAAWDLVFAHLVAVARRTHGDRAVLMGFSRRERDPVEALRIF